MEFFEGEGVGGYDPHHSERHFSLPMSLQRRLNTRRAARAAKRQRRINELEDRRARPAVVIPKAPVAWHVIVDTTCARYGVSFAQVKSPTRRRRMICNCASEIAFRLISYGTYGGARIHIGRAARLLNRSHTSIRRGVRRFAMRADILEPA